MPVTEDGIAAPVVSMDQRTNTSNIDGSWYDPPDTSANNSVIRTRTPEPDGMTQTESRTLTTDTQLLQTPATGTMATEPGSQPAAPEHPLVITNSPAAKTHTPAPSHHNSPRDSSTTLAETAESTMADITIYHHLLDDVMGEAVSRVLDEENPHFTADGGTATMSWDNLNATVQFQTPPTPFTFSLPNSQPSLFDTRPVFHQPPYPLTRPSLLPPYQLSQPSSALRAFSQPYVPDASKSITYQAPVGYSSAASTPSRQPKPSSYAQAARSRPPSSHPQHNLYTAPPTPAPTSAPLTSPEANRAQRAQIIRRADYDTTCNDIIRDLTGQFPGIPEPVMLESVVRDVHENRRFYITYTTAGMKRQVAGVGFKLGSVTIPPEDDLTEGYIPYPPHYCDSTSLRRLLQPYGTVHTDRFQTSPGGTRIGGYTFRLALHSGQTLPAEIVYNGYTMHVKAKDAPKICSFCKRHGHTVGACRTKKAAMAEKYEARRQYLGELRAATDGDANMQEAHVEGHVTNPRDVTPEGTPQPMQPEVQPTLTAVAEQLAAVADHQPDAEMAEVKKRPLSNAAGSQRKKKNRVNAPTPATDTPLLPATETAPQSSSAAVSPSSTSPKTVTANPEPETFTSTITYVTATKIPKKRLYQILATKSPDLEPSHNFIATTSTREDGKTEMQIHCTEGIYSIMRTVLQDIRRTKKPWQIDKLFDDTKHRKPR